MEVQDTAKTRHACVETKHRDVFECLPLSATLALCVLSVKY